ANTDRRSALARDCVSSVAEFLSVRSYRRIAAQTKRAPTKNRVSSVGCRLFDKRRLAGDAVDAVCQENRVIVHRRQASVDYA
ncbi:hypothetical protein, partial [Pseudomonas viridiflava]|uniref:hypothetical protein n=1 Tax=Pseudomonas viridiflava TaxID=33069 RepID=UPI00197FE86E